MGFLRELRTPLLISIASSVAVVTALRWNRTEKQVEPRHDLPPPQAELSLSLEELLVLLPPAEFGVRQFTPGEAATYRFVPAAELAAGTARPREVTLRVLRAAEARDRHLERHPTDIRGLAWLQWSGVRNWRGKPIDLYHLASPEFMRVTDVTPMYDYASDYIPLRSKRDASPAPQYVRLERGAVERLRVDNVEFEAIRFELLLHGGEPGDTPVRQATLWTSSSAPPHGLVRLEARTGVLELVPDAPASKLDVAPAIQPLIDGTSAIDQFCASCHEHDNPHRVLRPPK